jgi:hypothetical protein
MGEHRLTIRDYLRHSSLNVTNQYLQATATTKRLAQENLVDAILPTGSLSRSRSTVIQYTSKTIRFRSPAMVCRCECFGVGALIGY